MTNFFGSDGVLRFIFNPMSLFFAAVAVLGAAILRKQINDQGYGFSWIGSSAVSIVLFIIGDNIFENIKFPILMGVIGLLAGGFLLSEIIGDGYADG
jgi:hypothetical protein